MKNKEKFAKDIVESAIKGDQYFAYDKTLKRVVPCYGTSCNNCLFYDGKKSCKINRPNWANAEYKEPKIFTEREKAFIKLFPEIQYIARDKNNKIFGHLGRPFKDEQEGWWIYTDDPDSIVEINFGNLLRFESIQWEDEEPTSREEILGK